MLLENEDPEGSEEMKGGNESGVSSKALSFNEQLKNKFNEIACYKFNKNAWFQASGIANFLEYHNTNKAIIDHVNENDKICFSEIPYWVIFCCL